MEGNSDRKAPHPKKKSKALNFDGLRSHLKEKWVMLIASSHSQTHQSCRHKVEEVADEDFFVFEEYLEEWGCKE